GWGGGSGGAGRAAGCGGSWTATASRDVRGRPRGGDVDPRARDGRRSESATPCARPRLAEGRDTLAGAHGVRIRAQTTVPRPRTDVANHIPSTLIVHADPSPMTCATPTFP